MTIREMFSDPMISSIVIKALIVGLLVSICSSLLGVSLVLKRYSLIGDGLSHVGFFAMAIAALFQVSGDYSLEIAIPIVVLTAIVILRMSESGKMKGDAAIAIVSTAGLALGSIIFSLTGNGTKDVCTSLFGSTNIFTIDTKDLVLSVVLSICVLVLFIVFYTKIFAITFDDTFSRATGIKTNVYNMLLAILVAITIVLGMKMMGAIMISGLIIFPALSSMRVCKSFKTVMLVSALISVFCFVTGFFVACRFSIQTGPTVITINVAVFIVFAIIGAFFGKLLLRKAGKK